MKSVLSVIVLVLFGLSSGYPTPAGILVAASSLPDTVPPALVGIFPPPGSANDLTRITVTFSEAVTGVDALDLLINGVSATTVNGSGTGYTFTFQRPSFGPVDVRWAPDHGILDFARPANLFDERADNAAWLYYLEDHEAPGILQIHPPTGSIVRDLTQIEVNFTEPVAGVGAADLLINGQPAITSSGLGAGPYVFKFSSPMAGPVEIRWAPGLGITDLAENPNAFSGGSWSYTLDPKTFSGDVILNEFLAANENGLKDEEGEQQDWIEVFNRGQAAVNLAGWSLTDKASEPGQWSFPAVTLGAKQYLTVFASGKDRKPTGVNSKLHTNFKLSTAGEYLGLYNAEAPRTAISEITNYPEQRNDYSYGRLANGAWNYFRTPTPGLTNGSSPVEGVTLPVHFSVKRGYFNTPFNLFLTTEAAGAIIRYTLNGSEPTESGGLLYTNWLLIDRTTLLRAAAFKANHLPSRVETHSYLFNLPTSRRSLPALSLVTATNHLFGPTGIMSTSPRNTTRRGIAWERPVSVELIRPKDNGGFHSNAGLRIQGGDYVRQRYDPKAGLPFSKFSYRLYFRGDYGPSKLEYPWFDSPVQTFDHVVLRAGMNDHTDPFISDELVRRLASDTGQVASHGSLALLFLNGVYKGYYNPTERIDGEFLQSWHGGSENWDVIAQFGEIREGTGAEWTSLRSFINSRDLTIAANYQEVNRRMDLVNFVDYLLVNVYAATGDWPHNNWRAARERVPGAKFRFYIWDAEWSFGFSNPVTHNTFSNELNRRDTDIGNYYSKLKLNPEFRLLFADRIQKHFFNRGALTDSNVLTRFLELKTNMAGVLPNMRTTIRQTWVPQRRPNLMKHFATAGFNAFTNAPVFSQHGGRVPRSFPLTMTAPAGWIYYTTNGMDPRIAFTGALAPEAILYREGTPLLLETGLVVKARAFSATNSSALTEAAFQVAELGTPIRIAEVMYNPIGGDAYEFLELQNTGGTTVDLSFMSFTGIDFTFPQNTRLPAGGRMVLSASADPGAFARRYPGVRVAGTFQGSLSNGGERIALLDRDGGTIVSVDFDDEAGWPVGPDGGGSSLEILEADEDPDDPANWRASLKLGGTPGTSEMAAPGGRVLLNEVQAENVGSVPNGSSYPDWIELFNPSGDFVNLEGWSLTDDGNSRKFVFGAGNQIAPQGHLVVWCDDRMNSPGLHTGFSLNRSGESLFLYDASTNRVDAVTFGLQLPDRSLGRVGDLWQLTRPTPGSSNLPEQLGSPYSLVINEWMANSLPGSEDWIELYNTDTNYAVALKGLVLATSNVVFRLASSAFLAPGGYLQLHADEKKGWNHVDFKLAAAGGMILLYDESANELNRVRYGPQKEGVSQGRFPNGSANLVSFPATSSSGEPNYLLAKTGPLLNEIMAMNQSAVKDSAGRIADWIEVHNPSSLRLDLTGMRLSVEPAEPSQWFFPPGTLIEANGYLVVRCDGSRPASGTYEPDLNLGRSLAGESGGVYLFNALGQLTDYLEYGSQIPDRSIGRAGGAWRLLAQATPGTSNSSGADLGAISNVRLNEWMANPRSGNDWFELYNPESLPVELSGSYLTDDPSIVGQTNYQIAPLTFIPAQGWIRWEADSDPSQGRNHVSFSLDRLGETLRIHSPSLGQIDGVNMGSQIEGVSQGRLPDGGPNQVNFPFSPTPADGNYLPLVDVVINEILAHANPPLEQAIELHNPSAQPVDMGGWYLSDDSKNLKKYRIADDTVISAKGYKVFYQSQFEAVLGAPYLTLDAAHGGVLHLSVTDASGQFTGYRATVRLQASDNGVSLGRHLTSSGTDFVRMSERSFGLDNPTSVAQFRRGIGRVNSYPEIGPVVINEIMYHPIAGSGTNRVENSEEEFIELHNITDQAVPLYDPAHPTNTWRLRNAVEFNFPANVSLAPHEHLLLVGFDPALNGSALAACRSKYGVPSNIRTFGPYRGRLGNEEETVALLKPDPPLEKGSEPGFVPYVLIDQVRYRDQSPWPVEADGSGASLQRKLAAEYGNDPINWIGLPPTAGRWNDRGIDSDTDGDGLPDAWELVYYLNPKSALDAAQDNDGDGLTNLAEFLSGSNPQNAESTLRLESYLDADGSVLITTRAAAGKAYSVQYRDAADAGPWTTLVTIPAETATRVVELHDFPGIRTTTRFYRLTSP